MKPQPLLEKDIEKRIVDICRHFGAWPIKMASPGQRHLPDRLILASNGRAMFLEIKRPGAKPTTAQRAILQRLTDLGFVAKWTDDPEGVRKWLQDGAKSAWEIDNEISSRTLSARGDSFYL